VSNNDELTPEQLREELAQFEEAYGISSEEFYRRLLNGEIGGSPDNDAWSVLCGQAVRLGLFPVPPPPAGLPASQAKVVRLTPEMILEKLARLEAERGISSAAFYERYRAGLEGDSPDAMYWAWLCEVGMRAGVLSIPARA